VTANLLAVAAIITTIVLWWLEQHARHSSVDGLKDELRQLREASTPEGREAQGAALGVSIPDAAKREMVVTNAGPGTAHLQSVKILSAYAGRFDAGLSSPVDLAADETHRMLFIMGSADDPMQVQMCWTDATGGRERTQTLRPF
jgi:hypothetical protein